MSTTETASETADNPAWGELFADIFEKFLKNFNVDKVRTPVRELRKRFAGAPSEKLAMHLVRRASVKCGVAVCGASAVPIIGGTASLIADLSYVIDRECYLIASIAYLYGHQLSPEEALKDTLYCVGMSSGSFAGTKALSRVVAQGLKGEAFRAFLKRIGIELSQRALARMVPFVGPLVGGALSYTAVRSIGRIAIGLYSRRTPTATIIPYERSTPATA